MTRLIRLSPMSRGWRSALLIGVIVSLVAPNSVAALNGTTPSCSNDVLSANEDQTATGQLNCTDLDPSVADYEVVNDVSNGTLTLVHSDGSFSYKPSPNFNGSDSFDFTAADGDGTSVMKTISITVNALNDPPTFTNGGNVSASENAGLQTVPGWALPTSTGPPDESSQTLSFTVTNDNNALFSTEPTINSSGTLTYKPAPSQNGSALVSVQLFDSGLNGGGNDNSSAVKTFTITVTGVNDPPSFSAGADPTVLEDAGAQSVSNWATGISAGPPDESGQVVTFLVDGDTDPALFSTPPAVSSAGKLTYTPAADANGSADITLHAHDNGGGTADSPPQTFTINVTAVNDIPAFVSGADRTVPENAGTQTVSGWATGIDKGATNESAQTVNFVVTNDNNALFSIQPAVSSTGTLTYTPAVGASGSATVSVKIHDNGGTANGGVDTSSAQTLTITVTSINHAPSFTKGADQTDLEDAGPQSGPWATALSQGGADTGQTLDFVIESNSNVTMFSSQPAVSPTGVLSYTTKANTSGTATITLHLHDSGGTANGGDDTSASQSFTITVTAVNDPPSFTKGPNQTVNEDTGPYSIPNWATAMSAGPLDESSQLLDFVMDSDSNSAIFSVEPAVSPAGTLSYTLAPNANGVATIGLHIHDSGGVLDGGDDSGPTVTFKITVNNVNDPPTCANDSNATFVDSALNASLTSCTDVDADTLSYSLVGPPIHGTSVVNSNGTYKYTPNTAFQGTDTFTFKANDGTVDSNTATMSMLVSPDPIARNDVSPADFPAIVQGSGPTAIPVLANDLDKQGGPLLIQSVTQGAKGKVTITGGGTGLTYDPTGLVTGTDSFHYTIVDNQLRTNSAIVVVSIIKDTIGPVAISPVMKVSGPGIGSTTVRVRIAWGASDVGTGVHSYLLQESVSGGRFRTVALASGLSRSVTRNVLVGRGYRYRVRAADVMGNVGGFAYSQVMTTVRVQESSAAIVYVGHWGPTASSSYSGSHARWTRSAAANATLAFNGLGIAWVSSKGPSYGGAHVYIDGVLVQTVSLRTTRAAARQVIFAIRFAVAGPHTLQIVASGTAGHPRVDVDAFVIIR